MLELSTHLGMALNPQTSLLALDRAATGLFPLLPASLGVIPWERWPQKGPEWCLVSRGRVMLQPATPTWHRCPILTSTPRAKVTLLCTYLRDEGLGRQLVRCLCRRRRPWVRPCASSSPSPSEVPASGFICKARRLQDQHTYHERHILAARRWENASKRYIFKAFSHPAGAPGSSA